MPVENLVLAGAFDFLGRSREELLWEAFALTGDGRHELDLPEETPELPNRFPHERTLADYAVLGFSLDYHLVEHYRHRLRALKVVESSRLALHPKLTITYVRASRYGVSGLWNYTSQSYGGGNTGYVNTSNGNFVLTHSDGSVPARGFTVGLVHIYNSQDPNYQSSPYKGADFGEGWSFSEEPRLYPVDCSGTSCNAVVYKDGSGGANRTYVVDPDNTTANEVKYIRPLYFGWTLSGVSLRD